MQARTITARRLYTDIGEIEYPVIDVSADGTIAGISSDPSLASDTTVLAATFLDVHTHGAVGHDVMTASASDLGEMQRFLATRGVGHYLPTTVTGSIDEILHALESLANAIEAFAASPQPSQAAPMGIHLEGPFLSHLRRGVHPTHLLIPPTLELFDRFQQAARGHIQLITVAPELPGAIDFIQHATQRGVRISMGHTDANTEQALAGIAAGATSATHTYNAMRPMDHRNPGVLGTVLTTDSLYAELIADGIHVHPAMVDLWWRAKGRNRAILVTDAMAAAGMPDGDNYSLVGLPVVVKDGRAQLKDDLALGKSTLAGSILTMDKAVENLQAFTGASVADAVRAASHNPAAMLGQPAWKRLAPGMPANLNRFDVNGKLVATYLNGAVVGC
ncbi:N-acetylglucosamine 6-phosphate deacetylase [Bryocella elongata]|uniref:N-acetylglucosamine 6-phosphate deacetylase n=1 Tax=Bryocella elongata TaxID=863522 RepID=A0A1H5SG76_9BACT|nr:N-acetylglucosamine-6-phosphate deacetylase [Bryocella elongata]SEF49622.1 N-acetylglucosamine 6-phosphate deacetylase [Bryocella elongata]